MKKIIKKILERKVLAGGIALLLAVGGYLGYGAIFNEDGVAQYALAQVQKGTLVVSIAGSGQVSVSSQVDIKPKVSGDVVYLGVKNGQEVKAGTLIVQLDAGDAQKAVRDAEVNLESARLDLKSAKAGFGEDVLKQKVVVTNAYVKLLNSTPEAVPYDMRDDYSDTEPPTISANYILGKEGDIIVKTYASMGGISYNVSGLTGGGGMVNTITPQPLGDTGLSIKFATADGYQTNKTWIVHIPNKDAGDYIANHQNYQDELMELEKMENESGTSGIDIETKELNVRQKENALLDAQEKLADYFVRAPFAGIITNLDVERGEGISSATVIGTLVTKQKIAEASMNEIDIAKVKVSQKSTLTFDAIPDLTVNGQVAEMDTVGTVSQGVVTYNIKIGFDVQDDRVKPGMSVSAEIVTDTKTDVLFVPNSAVKSPNENHYVEVIDSINPQIALTANVSATQLLSPPRRQQVEVGISNDEVIEITSGLKEGDVVIIRTLQEGQNSPAQTSARPGLFGGGGR